MSNTKKGLRALGLSFLAVLGFMAFAAGAAQGQLAGKYLDAGGELAVGTTLTGNHEGGFLALLIAKLNMAILCTATDVEEGVVTTKLNAGPPHTAGTAHAKIKFLGCTTLTAALAAFGACKIGEGKTITVRAKLLAMLASAAHNEEPFMLAEPLDISKEPTAPFTTVIIENETGKFCPSTGAFVVRGTLALKVLAGLNNPQLIIPYANQALLGDELLFGGHPAVLDASLQIQITGPAGLTGAAFGIC